MNCFKPSFRLAKPYPGHNDYFKLHMYACNFIGIAVHLLGYGFVAHVQVNDPGKTFRSDSKETYRETSLEDV